MNENNNFVSKIKRKVAEYKEMIQKNANEKEYQEAVNFLNDLKVIFSTNLKFSDLLQHLV